MRAKIVAGVAVLLIVLLGMLSLRLGAVSMSWSELWAALQGHGEENHRTILLQLRAPRAVMALLCGGVLGASGVIAQGILRNPMAAPSLIGLSTGASFTAALAIVFPWHGLIPLLWLVPTAAFFGSALSAAFVFAIARSAGRTDVAVLLLGGLAVNSIAGAGTGLLTFLADDPQLRDITFWNLGSVAASSWDQILVLLVFSLPLLISLKTSAPVLNAWVLGEDEASLLGINVERQKWLQILILALSVGAAVSFTGVIGFVGLVVPHLLRMAIGTDHRQLLPQSFLWGAVLLMASDLVSRTIAVPEEMPIGIITACIGSPYFIYLLRNQMRRQNAGS